MKTGVVELTTALDFHQIATAKEIADTLLQHYPGHLWFVGWQGGSITVKNGAISAEYGFYIHPDATATASELAAKAVHYGGELLERAHMKRGMWDGKTAEVLEGSDARFDIEKLLNRAR